MTLLLKPKPKSLQRAAKSFVLQCKVSPLASPISYASFVLQHNQASIYSKIAFESRFNIPCSKSEYAITKNATVHRHSSSYSTRTLHAPTFRPSQLPNQYCTEKERAVACTRIPFKGILLTTPSHAKINADAILMFISSIILVHSFSFLSSLGPFPLNTRHRPYSSLLRRLVFNVSCISASSQQTSPKVQHKEGEYSRPLAPLTSLYPSYSPPQATSAPQPYSPP
jgi:hypothetical protein